MNPLLSQFSAMTGGPSGPGSKALASLLSGTSASGAAGLLGNASAASTGPGTGLPFNVVLQNVMPASAKGVNPIAANIVSAVRPAAFSPAATTQDINPASNTQPLAATSNLAPQAADPEAADPEAADPETGEMLAAAETDGAEITDMTDPAMTGVVAPAMPQTPDTLNANGSSGPAASATTPAAITPASDMSAANKETGSRGKPQTEVPAQAGGHNAGNAAEAVHAALTAGATGTAVAKTAGGKAVAQGQTDTTTAPGLEGDKPVQGERRALAGLEGDKPGQGERRTLAGLETTDPRQLAAQGKNGNAASSGHSGSHTSGQSGGHGGGQEGSAKSPNGNAQASQSAANQPGAVTNGSAAQAQTLAQFLAAQGKSSPMLASSMLTDDITSDPVLQPSYDVAAAPPQSLSASVGRQALAPGVALSTATHAATQIAVHIQHGLRNGQSDFHIRLDPPDLGRVDVKLEFGKDGRVTAAVATDNERHQGILERALQDAGLKTDSGSLSFTLQQENHRGAYKNNQGHTPSNGKEQPAMAAQKTVADTTFIMSDRALDIHV